MVDDLLLLARSDSGAVALERVPVDLGDVASTAARRRSRRPATRTRCGGERRPGAGRLLAGDPARLRQLVMILIDNAIRHSPERRPGRASGSGPTGGRDRCVVEDEGPGIRAEDLPRVFDRFYRAAGAPGGGTGLGLAIAAWIVERHGGRIAAANRPERRRALHGPAAAHPCPRRPRPLDSAAEMHDGPRDHLDFSTVRSSRTATAPGRSSAAMAPTSRGGPTRRPPPRPPGWPGSCARPASRPRRAAGARRRATRPGSGARPPTTSASPGSGDPREVARPQRRSGVGALVDRRSVQLGVGGDRAARRRATPTAWRSRWEGEDGDGPRADQRASSRPRSTAAARQLPSSASGPATGSASSCRCCPRRSSRSSPLGRLGAIFTPIFSGYARAGRRRAARRLRRDSC